jgi:hypothetical protein
MANRSDRVARAYGKLDRSEARERDIGARYQHIRRHIDVVRARGKLAEFDNAGFQGLLAQLDDNGVIFGADPVLPEDLARLHPRFGLTVVLAGKAPLIWLNLLKHDSIAALVDTVVHEAIHSTVRLLGRLPRTPEPDEAFASYGEEIVALAGANLILRKIAFPAHHEIQRNKVALFNCKKILSQLGCNEQFLRERLAEAELAANFFTDFSIEFACPTLEEVQSRSSRK